MKIKALTENRRDYYEGEILGKSIILRDLLNIEFPLNALTNDLGEYLGYDEEDFTKEELDSRVIVTDIYTDADGFIGAEIIFENENTLNENATQYRLTLDIVDDEYDLNETLDFYLEEIGGALRVEEQLIKRGEWPIVTFQTPNKNELIELLDIYTGGDSTDFLELIEEV